MAPLSVKQERKHESIVHQLVISFTQQPPLRCRAQHRVDHGDTIISSFPFPCPNNEKEKAPSLIAADDPARLDAQRPRRVVVAPGRAVRRQDVNSSKYVVSHVFFIVLVWIDSVIAAAHSRFMFVWSNL